MKKLLAILITLALLLCALPALTEGYDDALDAAFEAGRVKFTQANYPLPDLATCEIVAPPDELWQFAGIEPMDEAQMRAVLTQAELTVFSYAPDGQSGIGLLAVGGAALPFAMSPDRLAIIWPREDRGVQDSYGIMDKVYCLFIELCCHSSAAGQPADQRDMSAVWACDIGDGSQCHLWGPL